MQRRWITVGAAAVPGVALAAFSLVHPGYLDPTTARAWWQLHIPLLPFFPLLGGAVLVVLRGERGLVAGAARLLAYLYACLYTALDTVSGIAAGVVTESTGGSPAVGVLFAVGDTLGHVGIGCLAAAVVLAAGVLGGRGAGWRVLPGAAVLLVACWGFYVHHIFSPEGTWSMLGFAAGFALLAAARPAAARPGSPRPVPPPSSPAR